MANITDELAGTWVFNGNPSLASLYNVSKIYNFIFISNETEFNGLNVFSVFTNGGDGYDMYYIGENSAYAYRDHRYTGGGWKDPAYRTMTIISTLAEVTNGNTLLSWLKDYATKQVDEPEPEPEEPEEPETPTNSGMKLEVLYKGEVIGTISEGESIALHLNGQKLTEDLVVRAVKKSVQTLIKVYSGTVNLVATFDITEYAGQTFASVVNKTTIGSDGITYKLVNTINANWMYVVDANDYYFMGPVGYRTTNTIPADENINVFLAYN
jgi:hypothetical protein